MPISLKGLFEKGAAVAMDSLSGLIDNVVTNKEERETLKLEQAKEFNRHMEALESNVTRAQELENADRDSARDMNAKVQDSEKASWMAKNIAYILDVLVGLVWASLTLYIAAISARLIETKADFTGILSLYSTVVAVFMISLNFHRGTSRGSEKKQEMIDRMRKA